jgi:hypothetical protein
MLDRPTPQVTMTLGETRVQIDIPASEFLRDTPRSDGYEPLAYKLWEWHRAITTITKNKLHVATFRYLWNVARRLDVAHRQFEVVRAGIDRAAKLESDRIACRRQMFEVLGDTELAVKPCLAPFSSCLRSRDGSRRFASRSLVSSSGRRRQYWRCERTANTWRSMSYSDRSRTRTTNSLRSSARFIFSRSAA